MSTEENDRLHRQGLQCDEYRCQECCHHEFDSTKCYTCLGCGKQGEIHSLNIDETDRGDE